MKHIHCLRLSVWMALVSGICIISGCNGQLDQDLVNSFSNNDNDDNLSPSVTKGVEHITAISAVLNGKMNIGTEIPFDLVVGFQYAIKTGNLSSDPITIVAENVDDDNCYSVGISCLEPESEYYFRAFLCHNGNDTYYGETMSFTTKELTSMLKTGESSDVSYSSATLNATIDMTNIQYEDFSCGFYWGTSEVSLNNVVYGKDITEQSFSSVINNFDEGQKILFRSFIRIRERTYIGEIKSFITYRIKTDPYVTLDLGYSKVLMANISPSDFCDMKLIWSSSKDAVVTVDSSGKITAVSCGTAIIRIGTEDGTVRQVSVNVLVRNLPFCPSDAVDLGLSVYWRNKNLGASSYQNCGDYYKWAGLSAIDNNGDQTYFPYGAYSGTNLKSITKYNVLQSWGTCDYRYKLEDCDDVACVQLGGHWHIPTSAEWSELAGARCSRQWAIMNGVKGVKITSNVSGYTDKWIFLPAGGIRDGTNLTSPGTAGYYWSSSLNKSNSRQALEAHFGSSSSIYVGNTGRASALSVRPVTRY